jgi:hypothetical protein
MFLDLSKYYALRVTHTMVLLTLIIVRVLACVAILGEPTAMHFSQR